ncbi:MAG: peptidylprolyl isomerase [Flavobacteriaceae bacterium]|nr:peptidylprolyl isomerase [Bacteroidia bacterium]MBT8288032.1 peptidylprolyl isomerase [Bacteroidia bacterium]NNF75862.1 peptidylprolyl isomerase [Flavobacteriaceae bacterium]NNK73087.1 peptidylprolyl isomerase [Flavobacteriaceae bacterium]
MRLLLFFIILFTLSCEDKKTESNSLAKPTEETDVKIDTIAEDKVTKEKDTIEQEFPLLTEKNAMDFFLEYERENAENKVRITTDFGEIDILLYPKTKFHRANFIYLTKRNYFDNTQFYRVINNFMIQGGNTDDPKVKRKRRFIGKYLLPKDTKRGYRHDRGTISMPSSDIDNPHKLASPYEFFIIQNPRGEYRLDTDYTIFGKVIRGMNVVDKIAAVETDKADWPLKNVYIQKVEIIE